MLNFEGNRLSGDDLRTIVCDVIWDMIPGRLMYFDGILGRPAFWLNIPYVVVCRLH